LIPLEGTVWRLIFAGQDPLAPVASPEGRFHHSGQRAIYTSLTPEGCGVAIARYLTPGDPARVLVPLTLRRIFCADHRGNPGASVVWQDVRAAGKDSPTWVISDAARTQGAQAILYSSRSRPDLTHLVLLADPAALGAHSGPVQPWPG
jgi:hypothetical protein